MDIVELLVPMSLALGIGFVIAFSAAVRLGQFDDCETPAHRMLIDADAPKSEASSDQQAAQREPENSETEIKTENRFEKTSFKPTRVTERTTT